MDNITIFAAKYLILGVVLVAGMVWLSCRGTKRTELTMTIIAAGVVAVILTKLAGKLYYHPRPFVVQNITPLISHAADNGFPSEHTVLAMTLTSTLYYYRRGLAGLALILTLLVGWGRVAAHVHSWIDIAGGLVIGAAAGVFGYWLTKKFSRRPAAPSPTAKP